jgi:hypothetical protein
VLSTKARQPKRRVNPDNDPRPSSFREHSNNAEEVFEIQNARVDHVAEPHALAPTYSQNGTIVEEREDGQAILASVPPADVPPDAQGDRFGHFTC